MQKVGTVRDLLMVSKSKGRSIISTRLSAMTPTSSMIPTASMTKSLEVLTRSAAQMRS